MSKAPRCRKSAAIIASCDNCGAHPEIIHKPAERRGARYCEDCCPECRADRQAKRDSGASAALLHTAAAQPAPSSGTLALALQTRGFAVSPRALYRAAGLEHGLEIDGYFYPAWELNSERN